MSTPASTLSLHDAAKPLLDFYQRGGVAPPELLPIDGEDMPEPFRKLLVHADDMTPTLEHFHGSRIHLRMVNREVTEAAYTREVILEAGEGNQPVEFGAIAIHLEQFPEAARELILGESVPLGTILADHTILHQSCPQAYFRVNSDPLITEALGLPDSTELYGRCNIHRNLNGNHLAEIVEILPPASHVVV
jgi:chorismate-pyruvate lyase